MRKTDRERGSEAIEAAIGIPAFMLFVALIMAGGRLAIAHQSVESAAADAARSASIVRSQGEAHGAATSAAASSLSNQGLDCVSHTVNVDTSGFVVPVGTAGTVTVTVSCVVNLSDVAVPGLPGTQTITSTIVSPVDKHREH